MQHIGKSKIGSLSARKGISYPQLRLPQQFAEVIGETTFLKLNVEENVHF